MKKVFIHIGYPKCFSTTLQRSFFEKHPEIDFYGVGVNDNVSYIDSKVELLFESILKYAHDFFYEAHKNDLKIHLEKLINNSSKVPVFSSEYLAMKTFPDEIPSAVKYQRIKEIFQSFDIQILVIQREPISFLRSFYKENVRLGLSLTYKEFLINLINHQDRSFLLELNMMLKRDQLQSFFGSTNVTVLEFDEIIKDVQTNLNNQLSNWLSIQDISLLIPNDNPSLTDYQVQKMLSHNKEIRRGLGLPSFYAFEKHRNRVLYQINENLNLQNLYDDVLLKRQAIDKVKGENGKLNNSLFENSAELEKEIKELILNN